MIITLTFLVNATANFVLGFAVATVLGPEEFGRYAVAFMVAIVMSTALFDWLRLTVTRHYSEASRAQDPVLRASLNGLYIGGALLLAAGVALVLISGIDVGLPAVLLIAVAATGVANGQFEFWAALARARFLDMTYAKLVVAKNILAFSLMIGAGIVFHSATAVLAALVLSVAISILPVWRALRDPDARLGLAQRARIIGFAHYGFPIVTANVLYQVIILINRWVAAAQFGYAEAGQLSLATDLSIRLLLAIGAGFDVLLFQLAVRQETLNGRSAAQSQIARNIVLIAAVLFPLAAGYAATMPAFQAMFVPVRFRGAFAQISLILIPGVVAFCCTQFALGPIFQLKHRTGPLAWAAAAALACDLTLLAMLPHHSGAVAFALVHSASLILACAVAGLMAFRLPDCRPSLRDMAAILVATGAMTAAIWPLRYIDPPWLAFAGAITIGVPCYALLILVFDVGGLRGLIAPRFRVMQGTPVDEPSC